MYKGDSSPLIIGEEQIQVSEEIAAEKLNENSGLKRKEVAFAFSKRPESNYQITQTADSIEYENIHFHLQYRIYNNIVSLCI